VLSEKETASIARSAEPIATKTNVPKPRVFSLTGALFQTQAREKIQLPGARQLSGMSMAPLISYCPCFFLFFFNNFSEPHANLPFKDLPLMNSYSW